MEIVKNLNQGVFEVTMRGRFTFTDNALFREVILKFADNDVRQIVFHMALVEFVDSAALGMLLLSHDESEKHCKSLTLSGATGQVKKMFDMARFHTVFNIV